MNSDGDLFGDDALKIRKAINCNPSLKIVPLGLGPNAVNVKNLPGGIWLENPSLLADTVYRIMDYEFHEHANGRHGMQPTKTQWGSKWLAETARSRNEIENQTTTSG